jgi:hypothetical protein
MDREKGEEGKGKNEIRNGLEIGLETNPGDRILPVAGGRTAGLVTRL